jgi:hypothetical protein
MMEGKTGHNEEQESKANGIELKSPRADNLKLNLPDNGEQSSNMLEQAKIKVDTDVYSHYIE